jgi:hypothetical protein
MLTRFTVMGGATIADLVTSAVEKLPAELSLVGAETQRESEEPAASGTEPGTANDTVSGSTVAHGARKVDGAK